MRRSLITIFSRLTAGTMMLQALAPAALAIRSDVGVARKRHDVLSTSQVAMKGLPPLKRMVEVDPSKYIDPTRKDPVAFGNGWTLLNEQGAFRTEVTPRTEKAWRIELTEGPTRERRVRLLTMLGEAEIAHHEPLSAQARFSEAIRLAPKKSPDKGLATFDAALSLFRQGRFTLAKHAFRKAATSGLRGVDVRIATLYARHAELCEGYHQQRERMGIPEPDRLDPLCGVSALAVCLRGRQMPSDRADLSRKIFHDGEGSSMLDLQNALPKLGLSGQMVKADEEGLKRLPKPLVAFVEHDHFVAVVDADKNGVEYVCSDCGPWPGGPVRLSWKQWRAMEAGQFLAVAKRGTPEAVAIEELPTSKAQGPGHIAVASVRPQNAGAFTAAQKILSALGTSVIGQGNTLPHLPNTGQVSCGVSAICLHCLIDQLLAMFGGGFGGSIFGTRDPVNLATGEEEYKVPDGISVYNPTGPSVHFAPSYFSLANTTPNGFGGGWTHPYNMRIEIPSVSVVGGLSNGASASLVLPNSGRINFTVYKTPPGGGTGVPQQVVTTGGVPVRIEYLSGSFRVTFDDHKRWSFTLMSPGGGTGLVYYPTSIDDSLGNSIGLTWSPFTYNNIDVDRGGYKAMGLSAINDSSGAALLTLGYAANGRLASASDRFGRSIYYTVANYGNAGVPSNFPQSIDELTGISQIVSTGTSSPPGRFAYAYQNHRNGDGAETVPFLQTISVPSPTGTGTSTATINYNDANSATYGEVSDVVDANGNHTYFTPGMVGTTAQPNSTRVQVKSSGGALATQYDVYYDANMSQTSRVNAAGLTVWSRSYSDSTAPYSPTSVTDGNGRTWSETHDRWGHLTSRTSPKGTTTNIAYVTHSASTGQMPAVISSVSTGSHIGANYHYPNDEAFLPDSVLTPKPKAVSGDPVTQVETDYQYTTKGQVKKVTTPGNDAVSTKSWTYSYDYDGTTLVQNESLGEPVTVTDPLGHVTHYRYDTHGNMTAGTDAVGNTTQYQYTFDDRLWKTIAPHTGWGSGSVTSVNSYLYVGGPRTIATVADENGNVLRTVQYSYGKEGEPTGKSGSTEEVSTTYDSAYHVTRVGDGNGHGTIYGYDASGRLTKISYPLASGANYDQVQYTGYDPIGNVTSRTDGNGQVTNYTYGDADGLLSQIDYAGHASDRVTLAYDDLDRATGTTDPTGAASTAYDDLGNPRSSTRTYAGVPAQTLTYDYYPDGSRKTMSHPAAGTWTYHYDAAGRYASMASPAGTSSAYWYDNGWESDRVLPNNVVTSYEYTAAGALRHQYTNLYSAGGTTSYSDYNVNYRDGVFEPTDVAYSVTGSVGGTGYVDYAYDAKNRLINEQSSRFGGYSQSLGYDPAGNKSSVNGTDVSSYYTYDNGWKRPDLPGVYDGNGAPTVYNSPQAFDEESRLTSVQNGSGTATVLSAGYRADGLRAWKASGPATAAKTYFLYDRGEPVLELNSAGGLLAIDAFAPDGLVGRLVAGGSWVYYAFDLQGSAAQRLNASGSTLSTAGFDAWGRGVSDGAPSDPFGYDARWGYYRDPESQYYLCGHRYYDPFGRWVTRDPIGYAGGVNLYGYCGENPVGRADPSGLDPEGDEDDRLSGGFGTHGSGGLPYYRPPGHLPPDEVLPRDVDYSPPFDESPLPSPEPVPSGTALAPNPAPDAFEDPNTSTQGWYLGTNQNGQPYVGSSSDLFGRLGPGHHQLDLDQGVDVFAADCGTLTRRELEVEEQKIINGLGGRGVLGNKRNPVARRYWGKYGIPDVP